MIPIAITLYEAPPLKPEPVHEPAPTEIEQPEIPASTPATQSPAPVTSFTKAPDQTETIVQPPPRSSPVNTAPVENTPAPSDALSRAASILNRADCNRLTRERPANCPPSDPFAAITKREQDAGLSISNIQTFGPETAIEAWATKNSGFAPTSLFGEDNSIFIDPMAKGAYNAQRIRNGQTPIWDKEIEDALKGARNRP